MSVELQKTTSTGRVKLALKGVTPALANTLRRSILENVHTMAIDEVEITKNSSVLYDEVIAQRLGLFVLKTDLDSYNVPATCTCSGAGCSKCTLKLTLKAKGPCTVSAEDIKSKDPAVVPVYPKTLLVKLLKGQELELEATAVLGTGKTHAKYAPGLAWYQYAPKITVTNDKAAQEWLAKYPPLAIKDGKIDKKAIEELDLADACDGVNNEIVNIEYDPTKILFYLEPWGQLSPKKIMTQAIEELQTMIHTFEAAFDKA